MSTHFISDLHLQSENPALAGILIRYLSGPARTAEALYVLGDLFDAWPGDDDSGDPFNATVIDAFRALADSGIPLFFQHGNRDFLLGAEFARLTGGTLLPEEIVADIQGTPTLLMHGDQLCTDDVGYQQFRAQVRNPRWQQMVLSQPLAARKALAKEMRDGSDASKAGKTMDIMDVNADAVVDALRRHGVSRMVHGHTHRPARHLHDVDGRECTRIVLPDWREAGAYVSFDGETGETHPLT